MCIGDCKMNDNRILPPKTSYPNLDIAKFVCSLLVIVIHTGPFRKYPVADFYSCEVMARIAVPLFFGISGFLLFGRMTYENGRLVDCPKNRTRMLRYVKKTIRLYVVWFVLTLLSMLPQWYLNGWWGLVAVKDAIYSFLCAGPLHLWYLLDLIWAVPLMYVFLRFFSLRTLQVAAAVLWVTQCLDNSYSWLIGNRAVTLYPIFLRFRVLVSTLHNALPMIVFGASIAIDRRECKPEMRLRRFLLASGIWFLEATALYFSNLNQGNYSAVLIAPFWVYAALDFLTGAKQIPISTSTQYMLREMSLTIYCLHPLLIKFLELMNIDYGFLRWILITTVTVSIAYVWIRYKNKAAPAKS